MANIYRLREIRITVGTINKLHHPFLEANKHLRVILKYVVVQIKMSQHTLYSNSRSSEVLDFFKQPYT